MPFNPPTNCPGQVCLNGVNLTDLTAFADCPKFDANFIQQLNSIILKLNNDSTKLAESLCCVANSIPEIPEVPTSTLANYRGGGNVASAVISAGSVLKYTNWNDITSLTVDPNNVFTKVSGGLQVNKKGIYSYSTQVRPAGANGSSGMHISADGIWINSTFFNGFPDSEQSTSFSSVFQLVANGQVHLNVGDVIAWAARCDTHSIAFEIESSIALVQGA